MYHKPRMCRTCLQMSRGDFKFVSLDCVDPLWESNSPNLKDQLIYIIPELKLDSTEAFICTSCFIALRTAYEFKRMCQVTEQKFQSFNYKYRRPFGVGPGSPQFHVSLNENTSSTPNFRCQNLNYLQSDTSIDITEHHLYDASKVLPRKQLAYLNNVTQKLPEIDVEVIMSQTNGEKQTNADKQLNAAKQINAEKQSSTDKQTNVNKQPTNAEIKTNIDKQTNSEKINPERKTNLEQKIFEKPVTKETVESNKKVEIKDEKIKLEKKEVIDVKLEKIDEKTGSKEKSSEKLEIKVEKRDTIVEKNDVRIAKREEVVEKKDIKNEPLKEEKMELKQEKKECSLPKDLKLDLKSGNITLPNLPGIELVPRKLDSLAIRKKYNIGSQISILKTPKSLTVIDAVVKKACEEISYLKTNNILPEALNCSVRLEYLSSVVTTQNSKENYSLNEMKAIANAYYEGCTDDILTCKSCSRCFSTSYWLQVHEDEHTKEKGSEEQFNCTQCSANFQDSTSLQDHIKEHSTEEEALASSESEQAAPTIAIQSADKDTPIDNISKIAVPLLGNSQISLTPIPKDKKIIKASSDQSVTKVKEDTDISCNERQSLPANSQVELDKSDEDKTKLLDSAKQDDISQEDIFTVGNTKEDIGIASVKEKEKTSDSIEKDQELAVLDNDESLSHSSSPLPSPPDSVHSPSAEEQEEREVLEDEDTNVERSFVSEQVPTDIVQCSEAEDKKLETSIVTKTKKQKNKIKLLKLRFKSLFNKKVHLLKYSRCFICFRLFKTKFSLNQHCKFVHIPNTSDSNYWLNNIKAQKSEPTTAEAEAEPEAEPEPEPEPEIKVINDSQDEADTQETYYTPVRTAKSNKTSSHVCNICGKRVAEERFLELHMYVHTPTFVSMDPNVPQGKNGDVFRCYLCEKVFPKERYLKLHNLQVHLTKTIICKICNREFRSDFWYSQHKCVIPTEVPEVEEPVEDENNQFPCTVCNRKFARLRFMKSHRHRMHKDVNEDGTPKVNIKQENVPIIKESDVYDDSDDNDGSNYESDNEYDPHEMKESNRSELQTGDRTGINDLGSRRSLSRGVPKIQCDFCGDYIEETAYDKHIFEHNKLRLDKSLSKRKSLDSSISDTSEKKQVLLKCPVCSKPFKRKYNLNVHITKHHEGVEGFDLAADVSELNEPAEEEEKYLSDSESSQKEPPEIVYGQISLIDGIELYECCERTFRLKAHFYRHFKIKHPNCIFKPIYVEQKPVIDTKNVHDEHLVTVKQEINDKDLHKDTDKPVNLGEVEENFEAVEHSFKIEEAKALPKDEMEQKEVRKRGRRKKINPLSEQIVDHEGKDIASSNVDKRKLTTEFVSVNEERPTKRQRFIKRVSDDKSIKTTTSDDSEDMEATAHHLRQLDLFPVLNKNALGRYECHICEKRFKQKCQLRDHFNVHTGDKPYKCDFCNPVRGFTQTSSLYVHFRRVHAVVMQNCVWEVYSKNGSCLICSDVFDKHSHMFKHVKDHYIKKEFECQECHKKFHMSCHYKHHNLDPEEMHDQLVEDNLEMDEEDESEMEQETTLESMILPNVDDEKIDSDTDSSNAADKLSGCDESKPSKCTKCKKSFPNKQQLRFHKKSLAHIQKIQAIRSKVSEMSSDEMEEDSMKTDSEAIADIENGVKAIIKKIRTFKKHHCNICGASFIKRIHLKKHKRRHKMRRAYLKSREEPNTTDMDESQNEIEMRDASSNTNRAESNNTSHKTESENVPEATPSTLSEALSQLNPPIEIQLADKVPADTEIISITTSKATDELNSNLSREFVNISELSEKKLDGGSPTDEYGSFDVILKIAESTSDLNKQFLFKHTNANRGINFDTPKSSSNSNLNLKEDLPSQNTIIELPESTITYINPSHGDISLITNSHAVKDDKENKSDVPELDFTIEVSKCTEMPSSVDNSRSELKKSYNLNVEDIMLEMNSEPCENSLGKVDDKNFYSNLSNDLVILPISENVLANPCKTFERGSPLNDLSFHIVEPLLEETRSALTQIDVKTSDSAPEEQCNLQGPSLPQLEIREVESTVTAQSPSSVSDKCLDLGE